MHWSSNDTTRRIFIMITNSCNLKCSYCYETGKHIAFANICNIKNALFEELSSNEYQRYVISFHGGEPFMAFKEMREICEWIWGNFTEKDIVINTTTNGTIMGAEIREWLTDNKQRFQIILSLDGKAETHNINRDNSFDRIDKEFILSIYDMPNAKMTVTRDNLPNLYENFRYLYDLGFYPDPVIAGGVEWHLEHDLVVFEQQMQQLVTFYLDNKEIKLGSIFNIPIHKYSPLFKTNSSGFCGTGQTTIAYDVYGNRYPCHTFIANLSKPFDEQEINNVFCKLLNIGEYYATSSCKNCRFSISCSPCFGMNYIKRGDLFALDTDKCTFTRSTIIATAKLYAQALPNYKAYTWLKNKTKREIMHLALGVKQILNNK